MIKLSLAFIGIVISSLSFGQSRVFTKTGRISFYSKTKLENIEAHNRSVTCVFDTKTGNIQFAVLMKGFEFKKALMQEHFNENYIESDKYPRGEFKGQVTNSSSMEFDKQANYTGRIKGQLSIHGETKEVETEGMIQVKDGKIAMTSEFQIALSDYKISVPALVKDNISKTITIKVSCNLVPLK